MDVLGDILVGNVAYGSTGYFSTDYTSIVSSALVETLEIQAALSELHVPVSKFGGKNLTLAQGIKELFRDITLSLFSASNYP